jgi:selenocysteine-specific elongation factor
MTIDLGYAWTTLPSGQAVAFVDVPGHERFVTNMLAGVGPVPAVLLVVAADEGWMPQTDEHVRALDAFGVRRGLVVVTKTDVADSFAVVDDVRRRLTGTTLADVGAVAVSAETGDGMHELVAALDDMVGSLPAPDPAAPVRLWVDRSFSIRGAGTVVTGTLAAGTLRVGDTVEIAPAATTATVRGLESLKTRATTVSGVARVAVNLRGVDRDQVRRGDALVSPGAWQLTNAVDVVGATIGLPAECVVHIGSAAIPARLRALGPGAARVRLARELPLHIGDRLLLRDPTRHDVIAGVDVADLAPADLHGRGSAAQLAARLRVPATGDELVEIRSAVRAVEIGRSGLAETGTSVVVGDWRIAPTAWSRWRTDLAGVVDAAGGRVDVDGVREALRLPDLGVAKALVAADPTLVMDGSKVARRDATVELPPDVAALVDRLAAAPLAAPDGAEVAALDRAGLATASRQGLVLRIADGVFVGPAAVDVAVERLAALAQPFTVADARSALASSRRVVVPLLEHLDAGRRTRRLPDGTRLLVRRER